MQNDYLLIFLIEQIKKLLLFLSSLYLIISSGIGQLIESSLFLIY